MNKTLTKLGQFWSSLWLSGSGSSGYEAAKTNRNRSTIDLKVQTARQDIDKVTRRELQKKARYLFRNSPLVRGLIERLVVFTVGTGLHPIPISKSDRWNQRALDAWKGWAKQPDIESRNNFQTLQSILFRSVLIDGDIFTLDTYGPSGRPRIQMVEGQDICHKNTLDGHPDGIELDVFDRPKYYIWREETKIPADQVTHFMLPERAGQKRGITLLASIINTAHDVDDILALEKASVKDGSTKTDIIKTADGELPSEDGIGVSVQAEDATASLDEVTRYYRQAFSPEAKVLRHGDEHTPYISNRPSPAWQGFMDFLVDQICYGAGLPPSLLKGNKVGGADTRREVATAQRIIDNWQNSLITRLQQIYEYVIQEEINAGYLAGAPNDWRKTEWQKPPRLTVDAGREAEADREDVKLGLLTRREYFSRWGIDWKEETRQSAIEAKFIKDLAEEFDLDRGEIVLLDPNELSASAESKKVPEKNPDTSEKKAVKANRPRDKRGRFSSTKKGKIEYAKG